MGVIFADYRANFEEFSKNTPIYGHNLMTNPGVMFGELIQYKEIEFARTHQIVEISNQTQKTYWKIFSVFPTNVNFYYIQMSFRDTQFVDMVDQMRDRSLFNFDVAVGDDDPIILLSTCDYIFNDARFVIAARKLRDGELPENRMVWENPDPKNPRT